ncbi:MAG TPA: hypothetical protein PKD96_01830 [Candidatus Absconditabacterales bacterium]|nr:hypothetical protein [Candidatus Absconditabacterales bacterium]HMT27018.1 hypothetical protein [Candidatus Absconditabacterales bacterium]
MSGPEKELSKIDMKDTRKLKGAELRALKSIDNPETENQKKEINKIIDEKFRMKDVLSRMYGLKFDKQLLDYGKDKAAGNPTKSEVKFLYEVILNAGEFNKIGILKKERIAEMIEDKVDIVGVMQLYLKNAGYFDGEIDGRTSIQLMKAFMKYRNDTMSTEITQQKMPEKIEQEK